MGYRAAVQSNQHLLLYDSATGNAAVGHFGQSGNFILDHKMALSKFFTHLMRCGQYVVFYGYGTGAMQVGYITPAGNFQVTENVVAGVTRCL